MYKNLFGNLLSSILVWGDVSEELPPAFSKTIAPACSQLNIFCEDDEHDNEDYHYDDDDDDYGGWEDEEIENDDDLHLIGHHMWLISEQVTVRACFPSWAFFTFSIFIFF